jgi:UDP-N-acetylmuramate dehydrogenase
LKVGGKAEFYFEPENAEQLAELISCCHDEQVSVRVIGSGSNLLVRENGVSGFVVRLDGPSFTEISVDGNVVRAGAGALLSQLISESVKAGLAGLDTLVGIPGTVGGALKGNAGGRSGDIGQYVQSVEVLTAKGERFCRTEDELSFAYRQSSINELIILEGTFQLQTGDLDEITRRMRKLWIMKKATQPLSFQTAGCIFKNPRGMSAGALIEQAGLKGARMGAAEFSDRHANFIVTSESSKPDDVLKLIDKARAAVSRQFGVDLELEIQVW